MTRSMYSTWKIAFDKTWAGPSWTSWASRDRSDSWASTIRICSSFGNPSLASLTRLESPRSRKSQVVSRLRSAISSLASSVCCVPSSRPSASTSMRSFRWRSSSAPVSAASAARRFVSARPASTAAATGALPPGPSVRALLALRPEPAPRGRSSPDDSRGPFDWLRSIASSSSRRVCQRPSSSAYAAR